MSHFHSTIDRIRRRIGEVTFVLWQRTMRLARNFKALQIAVFKIDIRRFSVELMDIATMILGPCGMHAVRRDPVISTRVLGPIIPKGTRWNNWIRISIKANDWQFVGRSLALGIVIVGNPNHGGNARQPRCRPTILTQGPSEHATIGNTGGVDMILIDYDTSERNKNSLRKKVYSITRDTQTKIHFHKRTTNMIGKIVN